MEEYQSVANSELLFFCLNFSFFSDRLVYVGPVHLGRLFRLQIRNTNQGHFVDKKKLKDISPCEILDIILV